MFSKSLKHLEESETGYWQHFIFAMVAGLRLITAGLASLIHAIVPQWFPGLAAFTVIDLYKRRLEDHPNQDYQKMIGDNTQNESN